MLKNLLLCCFLGFGIAHAQQPEHSYLTDYRFKSPDDLLHYTFYPEEEAYPKEEITHKLLPGAVSFKMVPGYLMVKEGATESSFNMTSINPTEYGFKAELMNARNPAIQGHLKFIMDKNNQVDALVFKASREQKEVVYYMALISDKTIKRDDKYFTDVSDMNASNSQFLFGKSVYPYFQLDQDKKRIYPRDSISFSFTEKEVQTGRKMEKQRFVSFKFFKRAKDEFEDDEVSETTYTVKKIEEFETVGANGAKLRVIEMELKDFPAKTMSVVLTPKNTIDFIQFGATKFLLRNRLIHGAPKEE
jgi:hypothetical protein